MNTFAVWETEYPDEGSVVCDAYTENGAVRAYRKATGERCSRDDLTPLSAEEMTAEMVAEREHMASHGEAEWRAEVLP